MSPENRKLPLITAIVVPTILIAYILQMAPAPLLGMLREHYALGENDVLLNLSVSIVYPGTILASIAGGALQSRIGARRLFVLVGLLLSAGALVNLAAEGYGLFLLGRVIFSLGYGLSVPFIGSAIMNWYRPAGRERMNTLNGMFPFIGTVISFSLMLPLAGLFGSWKLAMGLWGAPLVVLLALWCACARERDLPGGASGPQRGEPGLYRKLWGRRDIRLLCFIFMLDFFFYSYIAAVLPTFFAEAGGMDAELANLCAALAFPAVGILGGILGGVLMARTGRRKPILAAGQIIKLAGIILLSLGAGLHMALGVAGAAVYGLGNGMWMPVLYTMPMEMPGMTPARTGATFAFITSCGFVVGFFSPMLGGWMTNLLAAAHPAAEYVARHAFGLKWSLFAFGFVDLAAFVLALLLGETSPGKGGEEANCV